MSTAAAGNGSRPVNGRHNVVMNAMINVFVLICGRVVNARSLSAYP